MLSHVSFSSEYSDSNKDEDLSKNQSYFQQESNFFQQESNFFQQESNFFQQESNFFQQESNWENKQKYLLENLLLNKEYKEEGLKNYDNFSFLNRTNFEENPDRKFYKNMKEFFFICFFINENKLNLKKKKEILQKANNLLKLKKNFDIFEKFVDNLKVNFIVCNGYNCKNCKNLNCKNFTKQKYLSNFEKCQNCQKCITEEIEFNYQKIKLTNGKKKIFNQILQKIKNSNIDNEDLIEKKKFKNSKKKNILEGIQKFTKINYLFLEKFWNFNLKEMEFNNNDEINLFEKEIKFISNLLKKTDSGNEKCKMEKEIGEISKIISEIKIEKITVENDCLKIKNNLKNIFQKKIKIKKKKSKISKFRIIKKKISDLEKEIKIKIQILITKKNNILKNIQRYYIVSNIDMFLEDHRYKKNIYNFLNNKINIKTYQNLTEYNILRNLKLGEFLVNIEKLYLKTNQKYCDAFKREFENLKNEDEEKFLFKLNQRNFEEFDYFKNILNFFNLGQMNCFLEEI